MKVKSFEGGFDKNFCYLVWCTQTKIASIIDPAVPSAPVIEFIKKNDLILSKIFITHTHQDHILYLDDFLYIYPNIEVMCYEKNIKQLSCNITKLSDYEIIPIGQELIISIYTPGHYADSMCYWNKKNKFLFTGDTIFVGRTGRTINNKSNIKDLYDSVYHKIFKLPHDTIIYPGHNYGFSKTISIKENISYSDFFSCKSLNDFVCVMKKFEENYQ